MSERGALETARRATSLARAFGSNSATTMPYRRPPANSHQSRAGRQRTRPLRWPADRLGHLHGYGHVRRLGASSPRAAPVPAELVPLALAGTAETLTLPQLWLRAALHGRRKRCHPQHTYCNLPLTLLNGPAARRQQQDRAPAQPGWAPWQQRHAPAAAQRDEYLQRPSGKHRESETRFGPPGTPGD